MSQNKIWQAGIFFSCNTANPVNIPDKTLVSIGMMEIPMSLAGLMCHWGRLHEACLHRYRLSMTQMVMAGYVDAVLIQESGEMIIPQDILCHTMADLENSPDLSFRVPYSPWILSIAWMRMRENNNLSPSQTKNKKQFDIKKLSLNHTSFYFIPLKLFLTLLKIYFLIIKQFLFILLFLKNHYIKSPFFFSPKI